MLSSCEKKEVTLEETPLQLFYKVEHVEGEYPYPIDPLGPVTTDSGYKYEINNGSSIYIKAHTELDFWLSDIQTKVSWTFEHVGYGGSIVDNTSTLKTNYNEPGEYILIIETPTIIKVKILVD